MGLLNLNTAGYVVYSLLWGTLCHHWFGLYHTTVSNGSVRDGNMTLTGRRFVQMIGGFLHPGKPMANMYFVLYSYSEMTWIRQNIG